MHLLSRPMKFRIAVPLLLLAGTAAPAHAQAPPLTLDQAVEQALAGNAGLRAVTAAEEAAAARVRQARAGYFPRVNLIESWQRSNHPVFVFSSLLAQRRFAASDFGLDTLNDPDALSNHRIGVAVEQTIFDGFRARWTTASAALDRRAAAHETAVAREDLRLLVVTTFGRAQAAAAGVGSARAAVETAAADLRQAEDRRNAGLETEASVLAFRVHLAETNARRIRAEADAAIARATLNGLLGVPLDDERPLAVLPGGAGPAPADLRALEDDAVRLRPELRAAALRIEQARAAGSAARSAFWPTVIAQGGAEANGATVGDRRTAWSAGIEVRWNLFAGGADAARLAEADAQARRAEAAREQLETEIRLAARSAHAGYEAALAREAASREMVAQARESQRIIRDRYEAGLAPATDVLRAAELLAQAEAARTAASIDVHVTAAALARAAGSQTRTP